MERTFFWKCALVGIAVLGVVHILIRTSAWGVAINADGVLYLSTASSLIAGEGLRTYSEHSFLLWPPFYPLLLAALGSVGLDMVEAGRWLNAAALGAIVLLVGLWLGPVLRYRVLVTAAAASIATALPLCHVSSYLLTEPLFCLFIFLALMHLHSFLNDENRKTALALSIVFAGLAAATRYIGVTAIVAGVLLLLFRRTLPVTTKLKQATLYGALSSIPVAIAMTRNWAVAGRPIGARAGEASGYSPLDSLRQLMDAAYVGLLPTDAPDWIGYLLLAILGLTALGAVFVWVSATRSGGAPKPHSSEGAAAYPCAIFAAIYLSLLILLSGSTTSSIVSPRYIAPAFAPLVVVAVFLLDRFMALEARGAVAVVKRSVAALALAGLMANIGLAALKNLQLTERALATGYHGYTTAAWQASATILSLRTNPIAGPLYSNDPAAVYYLLGGGGDKRAKYVKYVPNVATTEQCYAWLGRVGKAGGAHVVWFHERPRWAHDEVVTQDKAKWTKAWRNARRRCDLGALAGTSVTKLAELPDGTIYRIDAAAELGHLPETRNAR